MCTRRKNMCFCLSLSFLLVAASDDDVVQGYIYIYICYFFSFILFLPFFVFTPFFFLVVVIVVAATLFGTRDTHGCVAKCIRWRKKRIGRLTLM